MNTTHAFVPANEVQELIHRRRRQVLVHSVLYYVYDTNVIPDHLYNQWASELAQLQQDHPRDSQAVGFRFEEFRDYTGETGYHLPLHDKSARRIADHLRKSEESK